MTSTATLIDLLLLALAAYRCTVLVTSDQFPFGPVRERIWRRFPYPGSGLTQEMTPGTAEYDRHLKGTWLGMLIMCPACMGVWMAFGWWGFWRLWPAVAVAAAVPFAIAGFCRFLTARS